MTDYVYPDIVRHDVLRMVPPDGHVIGSVGCGSAATEAVLVGQGREVHGVDIAPQAIEKASARLATARLVAPDQFDVFEPESLDGLILADVIEHIPRAWSALARLAGAVRPGGWVVISVPNMRHVEVLGRFIVTGDWPEHPTGIFDETHVQVMSKTRLMRWLAGAGLRAEEWFDHYGRRPRLYRACDRLTLRLFHSWFTYQLQVRCRK